MPGVVRETVGISLGKGGSELKSHLLELVMRVDRGSVWGGEESFFCLRGQVWIMPCVKDGALYHFIEAVLFKNFPQVQERVGER